VAEDKMDHYFSVFIHINVTTGFSERYKREQKPPDTNPSLALYWPFTTPFKGLRHGNLLRLWVKYVLDSIKLNTFVRTQMLLGDQEKEMG